MAIAIDLVDGTGGRKSEDGWEFTRVATISGVGGSGYAKVKLAVDALISVVGDIGDPHPEVSECVITDFSPSAKASGVIEVRISYKEVHEDDPEYAEIDFQTTTSQVETNKDYNGDLIDLFYTYPPTYPDPKKAKPENNPFHQGGMVSKMLPETTVTYTRYEKTSPGAKSLQYTGKINTGAFEPVGAATAKTWFCVSISGKRVMKATSSAAKERWQTTYVFQYREDTWDQTALFINPDDGKPIADPSSADNTEQVVQVYEMIDFDALNL